jgi:hypothetical protein
VRAFACIEEQLLTEMRLSRATEIILAVNYTAQKHIGFCILVSQEKVITLKERLKNAVLF